MNRSYRSVSDFSARFPIYTVRQTALTAESSFGFTFQCNTFGTVGWKHDYFALQYTTHTIPRVKESVIVTVKIVDEIISGNGNKFVLLPHILLNLGRKWSFPTWPDE